jgi:small conductance mechanosensitive channel
MSEELITKLTYAGIFTGILLVTVLVASLTNRFFKRLIKRSTEALNTDPTNYKFLRHAAVAIIYLVGFSLAIYTLPSLRALASSLLAGAGILAVAIGFASQHALSNVISGIFIIFFRPFRVNDRIKLRELNGVVEDITLRHTVIRDFENRRILVPNALISDEIIVNADFGEGLICKWIDIGISYDSDIDLAKQIMREEALAHPFILDNRTPEQIAEGRDKVVIRIVMLGDSSVNLRAWAWAKDNADAFIMSCDLLESIKKRFDAEGIEIPFPHRTVYHKEKE